MKKLLFFIGFLGTCIALQAQSGTTQQLKFSATNVDVGSIVEDGGIVSRDVLVTNLCDNEVKILSTEADNKAAKFEWSRKSLKKYDRVHLKVSINPIGINYSFRIPFTVVTLCNKDTVRYKMMLGGYVNPKANTRDEEYRMQEGNLKYKDNSISFRMHRNEVRIDTIWFFNVWDSVMTFKPGDIPPFIKIIYLTKELKPQTEGFVVFSYSAPIKNDWGFVFDKFTLLTNDPEPNDHHKSKTFYTLVDIYDDFASWSKEQLENAPRLLIDTEEYHFGQCQIGDVINHDFVLTNIGKSPLVIHKVKTSCGCTTSKLEKDTIAPGESTKLTARFSTYGKRGGQSKDIDIITNDPDQPKVTMRIMGHVQDKPKQ